MNGEKIREETAAVEVDLRLICEEWIRFRLINEILDRIGVRFGILDGNYLGKYHFLTLTIRRGALL